MAKYECRLQGDFHELLQIINTEILDASASASYEDGTDYQSGETLCAVRVYERFSMVGGNRVSLNMTLIGNGCDLFLSAITSGGSQAMLFKINTWGEEAFLESIATIVNRYKETKS